MKLNNLFSQSPKGPLKKLAMGGLGSFLLVLILPKSFRLFIRYGFAGLAKNMLYIVLAGLLTQKIADWLVKDAPLSKRSSE